ncbi:cytochrome P450 [Achlya hypogyna]|uniref:Cytochrome P450 n=1 Tax=Achlya hypogyna TaxID=1202772 RepID=A0A1V9YJX4_ACHHY|nr:cytochrome P450 [Achlya hypogyna]
MLDFGSTGSLGVTAISLGLVWLYLHLGRNEPFATGFTFPKHMHQPFVGIIRWLQTVDSAKALFVDAADDEGIVSFKLVMANVVSVTKAAHLRQIVCATNHRVVVPIIAHHIRKLLGDKTLLLLVHDEWKAHRRLIARAFHWQSLAAMVPTMSNSSDTFVSMALATSATGAPIDVYPLLKLAALDTIGLTGFGYNFGALTEGKNAVATAFEFLLEETSRRGFTETLHPTSMFYWLPTAANRRYHEQSNILRSALNEVIAKRMADQSGTVYNDLLASMLAAAAEEETVVTADTFADNVLSFLFAGFDTTSTGLAYTCYLLSMYLDVQEKAVAEIDAVLGTAAITYDALQNLPYMTAVVTEALRLFPPAPITTRTLENDLIISGRTIPKDTMIYMPIWFINRSKHNWGEDADEFKPERHLVKDEDETMPAKDRAYRTMTFSGGPRNCVGLRFAMMETVITLVSLLRRCRLSRPADAPPITIKISSILQVPENGVWVNVMPVAASG